ncbi:MAG: AAA family ATPase [Candidatus Aminicenantes bacterium]|nr:AAA family ATPase [Candidatus Aminicenantes bacterium]
MDMKKLAVGESDFKKIITENYYYVDKSLFIKEIIDRGDTILLLPRPRRFGKTINISMLKYFYDCCPEDLPRQTGAPFLESKPVTPGNTYKSLFDSLAISKAGPQYLEKMGQHPVIFLTFKNIKESDWETTYRKIKKLIRQEYARHCCLLNSKVLMPFELDYFQKIIDLEGEKEDYENSLEYLLIFLNRYYGRRAVILIDEYDAPIHAGFTNNYYDEIIDFMRNFLCAGLKDTGQYLEKSVITGIMRIARESIFSGLNNPGVYTLLAEEFDDKFGFTEKEVETMLADFNVLHMYEQVQQWYNGYKFGNTIIYNPWSVINFLASKGKELEPYWINTSDNKVVESLLSRGGKELKAEMEQLFRGEFIEKTIEKNIILKDIESDEDSLWSFLLMGGYLKQTEKRMDASGSIYYKLSIPNMEVRTIYKRIIQRYFTDKIENNKLEIMLKALIDGDVKLFEKMLRKVIAAVFSYHDFGSEPEKVYHALVAGLLVWISNTHEIKSNRESGYGRYDISIIPHDLRLTGYVIEFKTVDADDNETVESAVNAALKQIEDKKYETELVERGVKNYKKLAIVFNGKEVTIREG